MKSVLTVLAVLLLVPAAASARPLDDGVPSSSLGVPPELVAPQQDLRNADQRAPSVVPVQVHGTDVAAADQQSPKVAPAPVHVSAPAPGFDWGTAAIGAAISLLLMTALLGIAVTVRRRHTIITG
jgi:hypothetical protein